MSISKKLIMGAVLALAGFGTSVANAATYSLLFQGVTFTIDATDGDSSFTLNIKDALSTTDPDWADIATLSALGFKDLGIDFSAAGVSAELTVVPDDGTAWAGLNAELNASGCSTNGTPDGAICFSGVPPLAASDDMTFKITITGATLAIAAGGPHVKIRWLDAAGKKEGSLMSRDIPLDTDTDTDTDVPEPGTLGLLGLGLLGLGMSRRRRNA